MIRWLLGGVVGAGAQEEVAWLSGIRQRIEASLRADLTACGLDRDVQGVVLQYGPALAEQLGLRVGKWRGAYYGGESLYVVGLAGRESVRPHVRFRREKELRACPAISPSAGGLVESDDGMHILDGGRNGP